jgi:FKBP-type peptidyl-prolyl cis-trans isomerase (trigger factor)
MPEIPAPDYKGIELTRRIRPVSDAEIEDIIEERRQEQSVLIPVENRKSEKGDTVIVDLTGTFADEPDAAPIQADDLEIPLGDEVIEEAFTENLDRRRRRRRKRIYGFVSG